MHSGDYILSEAKDNVVTAVCELARGQVLSVQGRTLSIRERIPAWHKVAIEDIQRGEPVRKYGSRIGTATAFIKTGSLVHSHNLKTDQAA
jgi:altronate hydrolase